MSVPAPVTEMRHAILPDRMPPLAPEQLSDAQRQAVADITAGPRGEIRGPFWPMLRSPGLMMAVHKVGEYTRYHCKLDHRLNELATMMAARAWTSQYAWNAHYGKTVMAGVHPDTLQAIAEGRRPADMKPDEEMLYDFVTEVLATKGASDTTYARAVAQFGEEGVIDILGIVGYYQMLAMILNVARTAFTDGRPFPLPHFPVQLESLTPGAASANNYTMLASQAKEFETRQA